MPRQRPGRRLPGTGTKNHQMKHRNTMMAAMGLILSLAPAEARETREPIEIMGPDKLRVANKPGVEKTCKYLRKPNAVVTKNGILIALAPGAP